MSEGQKCLGVLGWLIGHKYVKTVGDHALESDYCWRCGRKRGAAE